MIDFSSMFTVMAQSWAGEIWYTICFMILGALYNLVSYTFKLFTLVCQINFTSLYSIISPLIDRLEALVMVLILFKAGVALIGYLVNPDSFVSDGKKMLKNIFIVIILLLSYNFIFDVFNELSMLIIGSPDGYNFTRLPDIVEIDESGDSGLISRFIFGETDIDADLGDYVAYQTLHIFFEDSDDSFKSTLVDGDEIDFNKLDNLAPYIGKSVKYTGLIGSVIGIYMIICIAQATLEIGVRMFKLITLQIIAPIAIISIVKDGTKGKIFSNFISMYTKTYLEAFARMASMLIMIVFICKFYMNIGDFFSASAFGNDENTLTKGLLLVIVVVAGFKFAKELPKFLDGVLGTHMADAKGMSFGKYIGGVIGAGVGTVGGLAAGFRAGGIRGVGNALYNGLSGGIGGAMSGAKGKNISETFKNINENNKKTGERAQRIMRQGGAAAYALQNAESFLGIPQAQQVREARENDDAKAFDNMIAVRSNAMKDVGSTGASGRTRMQDSHGKKYVVKYGESADSYATAALEYDKKYQEKLNAYQRSRSNDDYEAMIAEREAATNAYKEEYNNALFNNSDVDANESVSIATKLYDRRADSGYKSKDIKNNNNLSIKDVKNHYKESATRLHNKGANQRSQRQQIYGGK